MRRGITGAIPALIVTVVGCASEEPPVPASPSPSTASFCRSTTCKGAGCTIDENGCPASGKPLWWGRRCVGFSLQQNGSRMVPLAQVRGVLQNAFKTWSGAICADAKPAGISIGQLGDTPCDTSTYDASGANVNVIVFRDDRWEFKGVEDNVAKTVVHFDGNTGEILDADIEINTAHNLFTTGTSNVNYDLQAVVTHEIGHFLGFAHSPLPWSVMYPDYQKGTIDGRKLAPEDIAGLCAVYPPDRPGGCDLTPNGGQAFCDGTDGGLCSASGMDRRGPGSPTGLLPLAAMLGLLIARRKPWNWRWKTGAWR